MTDYERLETRLVKLEVEVAELRKAISVVEQLARVYGSTQTGPTPTKKH